MLRWRTRMTDDTSNPIIERLINWLLSTKLVKWLDAVAGWIRKFLKVAHLGRFSFWISVLGSASLFATNQSTDILRVIARDTEHPIRSGLSKSNATVRTSSRTCPE